MGVMTANSGHTEESWTNPLGAGAPTQSFSEKTYRSKSSIVSGASLVDGMLVLPQHSRTSNDTASPGYNASPAFQIRRGETARRGRAGTDVSVTSLMPGLI